MRIFFAAMSFSSAMVSPTRSAIDVLFRRAGFPPEQLDEQPALLLPCLFIATNQAAGDLMAAKSDFNIAVLPGDGIGVDVTDEAVKVLRAVQQAGGTFALNLKTYECGARCYQRTGDDLPEATLRAC